MMRLLHKKWVLNLLIGFFAAVFLVSTGLIVYELLQSNKNRDEYDTLAGMVDHFQDYLPSATENAENGAPDASTDNKEGTGYGLIYIADPETGVSVPIMEKYAQIYLLNNDLVGWLTIPGTRVNYPVMQTPDEPNYYLKRNFYKESSKYGCLYAQQICDVAAPSDNVTIFGHNMKDSSMFADLLKYQRKNFFEEHPTLIFDTLTEHHEYEIFSVFITTATSGSGFPYHQFVDAKDEGEFDNFVRMCKGYSLYDTGVDAEYGDKFICLSTCEYTHTNGRFVVVAKRID